MISAVAEVLKDHQIRSSADLIDLSRKGLQAKYISTVMEYTGLSYRELSSALPISERQLVRYASDKILKPEVTERLLRLIELYSFGYDFLKDKDEFQRWMTTDNIALGGITPISLIDTGYGIELVRTIIGRATHGIFS